MEVVVCGVMDLPLPMTPILPPKLSVVLNIDSRLVEKPAFFELLLKFCQETLDLF